MRDRAFELVQAGKYDEALPLFHQVFRADPSDWNAIYLAGQCCRWLNDFDGAIDCLQQAAKINPNEGPIFLALGIACQLKEDWGAAMDALKRAIQIDPDYVLAFNSLAMTQKRMGELEKADHNYEAGAIALTRQIVKSMTNLSENPILPHGTSTNDLWTEYAVQGGLYLAAMEDRLEGIAWPTGEMAEEESRTHKHEGLLWVDQSDTDGKPLRLFLPNFFNTFRLTLQSNRTYSELMGNRGLVLEMLGKQEEAQKHFQEADEFLPRNG
jgi:tetratricopeptide (TPR) repeat protein